MTDPEDQTETFVVSEEGEIKVSKSAARALNAQLIIRNIIIQCVMFLLSVTGFSFVFGLVALAGIQGCAVMGQDPGIYPSLSGEAVYIHVDKACTINMDPLRSNYDMQADFDHCVKAMTIMNMVDELEGKTMPPIKYEQLDDLYPTE